MPGAYEEYSARGNYGYNFQESGPTPADTAVFVTVSYGLYKLSVKKNDDAAQAPFSALETFFILIIELVIYHLHTIFGFYTMPRMPL